MSARSILTTFNRFFLICGSGSLNYNECKPKTMTMLYILRCTIICCGLKTFFNRNQWIQSFDPYIFDTTSLVLMFCMETMLIGPILSNVWRLYFDNQLSVVLTKLEGVHDKLISLNVVRTMEIKMNWIFFWGICVHFIAYNGNMIYLLVFNLKFNNTFISVVATLVSKMCVCIGFYEYILLILYIKWMLYIINEQIPKSKSTISTFRDLYLEVIECLNGINRSIYGLPVIANYIVVNVAVIITILFYEVIFAENISLGFFIIFHIEEIIITLVNIIILYVIGYATAKEINRMSLVLQRRSIIERNPRIKRQIKFFMLRRCHEYYHFELYGFHKINLRQLLFITNKAIAYLVIQILFALDKKNI